MRQSGQFMGTPRRDENVMPAEDLAWLSMQRTWKVWAHSRTAI